MILADTSVWVDHLRRRDDRLVALLQEDEVCCHPFVIGEIACGSLRNRGEVLGLLAALPRIESLEHIEALALLDAHALAGSGLGWIDVHLLGAAVLARVPMWTHDRRLAGAARRLGVAWPSPPASP